MGEQRKGRGRPRQADPPAKVKFTTTRSAKDRGERAAKAEGTSLPALCRRWFEGLFGRSSREEGGDGDGER